MADFSGPLTIRIAGQLSGIRNGSLVAELKSTAYLQNMHVDADGMLSGFAAVVGRVTIVVTDYENQTTTATSDYRWGMPVFEPVSTFGLPVDAIGTDLGFGAWFGSAGFGPDRTTVAINGGGRFDTGPLGTPRIAGTATSSGLLAIVEPYYSIAPLEAAVLEGDSGTADVTFRITRISPDGAPSLVTWMLGADLGRMADGTAQSGEIAFAQDQTEALLTVGVRGNIDHDPDWPLTIGLLERPWVWYPRATESLFATSTTATTTVLNDDTLRQVGIVAVDADKPEGDSGITEFVFRVFRSGGAMDQPLAVTLQVADNGSQLRPADLWDTSGGFGNHDLVIPANEASILFTVPIAGDTTPEPTETFVVSIWQYGGNVDEVDLTHRQALGRIQADDQHRDGLLSVSRSETGAAVAATARFYDGPVFGPVSEYVSVTPENLNVAVRSPGWFLRTGAGNDALRAFGGTNVLDGGGGSNFLTGGGGRDSFFIDTRGLDAPVWSTVENFATSASVTIWGIAEADTDIAWFDWLGASGHEGLTLVATTPDRPAAALTLPYFTTENIESGRIRWYFDREPVSGSDFMRVIM
jgi:hypothetical protein